MSHKKIKISAEFSGVRIDKILAAHSDIPSRSQALRLLQEGLVTVNGKRVKASYITQDNDSIQFCFPKQKENLNSEPVNFNLDILHEDEDLIIINKPSGIVVHSSPGHESNTLVDALRQHTSDLSMGFAEHRPGIVHRLDKDTSGVMVVAKNNFTHQSLAEQFKEKTTERTYFAITYGPTTKINYKKEVESYLIRHPKNRKKYASEKIIPGQDPKGRWSKTHFKKLIENNNGLSLIQCQLETGRTHQIRIHLSELGYPILGDNIYGHIHRSQHLRQDIKKEIKNMTRIALHAATLGFLHPQKNERLYFHTPWPENMLPLLKMLNFPRESE